MSPSENKHMSSRFLEKSNIIKFDYILYKNVVVFRKYNNYH